MTNVYASARDAKRVAQRLRKETGQRHVVRAFALGNKVAYAVVNVERFSG